MRKIKSPEEIEKSKKRNGRILTVFLLIILVGSIAGFAFVSNPNDPSVTPSSNGLQNIGNQWILDFQGQRLVFNSDPELTKNISVEIYSDLGTFYNNELYIDSNYSAMTSEIAYNLGRFSSRVQEACYGECDLDLPQKDCTSNIIVFRYSNQNRVYQNDSCIFIDGDLKAVDAFLYKLFVG